ncbi:MAG: PAS domain S-box protein [Acidobacteriota bacterium]|nr:PAS domain S-box protein [Acidobacteriota bacterium]
MSRKVSENSPTVLVVNDTPDMLQMLCAMLEHHGYKVVCASSGVQALQLAQTMLPDVVVSDVVMPGMNGFEVCRQLKQHASTSSIPVLLTSALMEGSDNRLLGLGEGADDYLEMPDGLYELPVKVARHAERHRVEQHYRNLVEGAVDIIYTSSVEGNITSINEAGALFFGRPVGALVGIPLSELIEAKSGVAVNVTGDEKIDGPSGLVYRVRDERGEERYLEAVNALMRDPHGQVVGVRGVMRNITERRQAEDRLRESEERYRMLFEGNPQPMWVYDLDTFAFLAVNDAALYHYGYSREEFLAMTIKDIRPPEDVPALIESVAKMHRGLSTPRTWRHRKKDGQIIDVEITSGEVNFDGHRARLVLATDITKRKGAEEALRESEERLRAQYQEFPIPTYSWRCIGDDFTLIDCNSAAVELTYGRVAELLGLKASDVYSDRPDIINDFGECFREKKTLKREFRYRMKSTGEEKDLMVTYVFVPPDLVMAHLDDITERKRAEESRTQLHGLIRKAAIEWRTTFDAIQFPVLIVDNSGSIKRLNRAAQELSIKSYKELLGEPIESLGPGQPWQKAGELVHQVRDTLFTTTARVHDETDKKTWEVTANILVEFESGEEVEVAIVARDVTRSVELEASLRRSEMMSMMGSLVAGVAHEVRNPLFGISSTLDAFEARFGAQKEHERYISVLRTELDRMNSLMKDLLELGKPLAGEFYQGSIKDLLDQAVRSCAPLAARSGVEILNRSDENLPPLKMERRRVIQVFQNLIENAIHHTPPGGTITVEAEEVEEEDGRWIECRVKDTGSGFQPEDLKRIFEPFFTKRRKGSGLGLSIVQRIMEEHSGTVTAGNRPEGGAIMTIRFPLKVSQESGV